MILKFQVQSKINENRIPWVFIDGIVGIQSETIYKNDPDWNEMPDVNQDHRFYCGKEDGEEWKKMKESQYKIIYIKYVNGDNKSIAVNGNTFLLGDNGKTIERL